MQKILPDLPNIEIINIENIKPSTFEYLKIIGRWVKFKYSDGSISKLFWSQHVYRHGGINASVICAYFYQNNNIYVYLRNAVRPGVEAYNHQDLNLWELPAGKIDNESPQSCAARELMEEVGFDLPEHELHELGCPIYASVGLMGEKLHFFSCLVNPEKIKKPTEDGSPMEHGAKIITVTLDDALAAIKNGEIKDSKTEIDLKRLKEEIYG